MSTVVQIGSENLVNITTPDDQTDASAADLGNGTYVVTWSDLGPGDGSAGAILGRLYSNDGTPVSGEFRINTTTSQNQFDPAVTTLKNGDFVVSWTDFSTGGDNIRAQVVNADGSKQGPEIFVHDVADQKRSNSDITALDNGGFVITWRDASSSSGDGSSNAVRAQVFQADGTKVGSAIDVNTETHNSQAFPSVAGLSNGDFVVVWEDRSANGSLGDTDSAAIRGQRYQADGTPIGGEFLVNTTTASNQYLPDVTALAGGRFVVAWNDHSQSGGDTSGEAIRAQVFNADGTKSNAEFLVNTSTAGEQDQPSITALDTGGFVVVWTDFSQSGGDTSSSAIRGQVYDASGTPDGGEFLVNTTTLDAQNKPSVADLGGGRFIVTWEDSSETGGDTDNTAIRSQIFELDETILGSSGADTLTGTSGPDTISALDGNDLVSALDGDDTVFGDAGRDTLYGGGGNDVLHGGDGNDTLYGAGGDDTLYGEAANDILSGGDGDDSLIGGAGHDSLIGGSGDDLLSGGDGQDFLRGIAGNNLIYGASGADTISGGAGNDTLYGGEGNDFLSGFSGSDLLYGGDGDDVVRGGGNADTLYGGDGNDTFGGGGDTIGDLSVGDVVQITGVTGLSTANVRFNGTDLEIDTNATDFATVEVTIGTDTELGGTLAFTVADFGINTLITFTEAPAPILGTTGNDLLAGTVGDDTISALDGDDTVSALGGNDVVSSGAGFDVVYGGGGDDTLVNSAAVSTDAGLDTLYGGDGNDVILNEGPASQLFGGDGDDTITGGYAGDLIDGGAGADVIDGGAGSNTVSYASSDAAVSVNLSDGLAESGGDAEGDQLTNIQRIVATGFDDTIVGDALDNLISAGDGDDLIRQGAGRDTIWGGAGNDTFEGSLSDFYSGINTQDGLAGFETGDLIRITGVTLSPGQLSLAANGPTGTYLNIDTDTDGSTDAFISIGGAFDGAVVSVVDGDTEISLNTSGVVVSSQALLGTSGNDLITGTAGNDSIIGLDGSDTLLGAAGEDMLDGGSAPDVLIGGDGADTLSGGGGNDVLYGVTGDDVLYGGDGVDNVSGMAGADTLYGGAGGDILSGGAGNDVLSGGDGDDVLAGVSGSNRLVGGTGADVLIGAHGADTLSGGGGNDVLYGVTGDDVLYGGDGVDNVSGMAGADTLYGGAGSDILSGGAGNDELSGGDGDDVLSAVSGSDRLVGGTGADTLVGADGNDTLSGGDDDDILYGVTGSDALYGGDGADTLSGMDGADTLAGGSGADLLLGGGGNDVFVLDAGDGADTIVGFAGSDDLVDLDDSYGVTSQAALDAVASDDGAGNAQLDFGSGDRLILMGIDYRDLLIEDFI